MKQLTCEMCGSTDLIKQDGVFVCQSCGCKYSVEEAKKMMIEVKGTVKIDNSEQTGNYVSLALSTLDNDEYKECLKYCNKALEYNARNTEALKIKAECYARMNKNGESINTLRKISKGNVIDDDAVEFLFEYIAEFIKAPSGKSLKARVRSSVCADEDNLDRLVDSFCLGMVVDLKKKSNAVKVYRHIIRRWISDLYDHEFYGESSSKSFEITSAISQRSFEGLDIYDQLCCFDDDIEGSSEMLRVIKSVNEKLCLLDSSYRLETDDIKVCEFNAKVIMDLYLKNQTIQSIEDGTIQDYELNEYNKHIRELDFWVCKIKEIDAEHQFSKKYQDKIEKIYKTKTTAENKTKTMENAKKTKDNLCMIFILGAIIGFIIVIINIFTNNMSMVIGGIVCTVVCGFLNYVLDR